MTLRKAVKNETELAGMREAHLRDAVAIVEFLTWLDEKVALHRHRLGRAELVVGLLIYES